MSAHRYAVFAGSHYYPSEGFGDFVSWHDSPVEAVKTALDKRAELDAKGGPFHWWQVWIVFDDGRNPVMVVHS